MDRGITGQIMEKIYLLKFGRCHCKNEINAINMIKKRKISLTVA